MKLNRILSTRLHNSILKSLVFLVLFINYSTNLKAGVWSYPNGNNKKLANPVISSLGLVGYDYLSKNDLEYTVQGSAQFYTDFVVEIEIIKPSNLITKFHGYVNEITQYAGVEHHGAISNQYGTLKIKCGINILMHPNEIVCSEFKIRYKITFGFYPQFNSDWAEIVVLRNENLSNLQNLAQRQGVDAALANPDLMIRDNIKDAGFEPFSSSIWNNDYREITQSSDLFNNHYPYGTGGTREVFENPMHSINTPQIWNTFVVKVRNRSCMSTPPAELNAYWTIARLWEPWASDWKNYQTFSNEQTGNNFVLDKSNIPRPLGNNITLSDKYNYSSGQQSIIIPALPPAGSKLVLAEWIVPNPEWYLGPSTLPIQVKSTGEPVICLLARIEETWKTNNGYYLNPNTASTKTNIVDYVSANNNAATRNSFILNSKNGYKFLPVGQNPSSRVGIIAINNPENLPSINIGLLRDLAANEEAVNFTDNARVNLYLDSIVWARWVAGGMLGNNFTVIESQIIQITDPDFASLSNIILDDNELGYIGVEVEYLANYLPDSTYNYNFSIGAIDINNTTPVMIGSPTHFESIILDSIKHDIGDGSIYKTNVGLSDIENIDFKIYPNPACDFVIITDLPTSDRFEVSLLDINGKKICEKTLFKNNGTLRFDLTDISVGFYIIKITSEIGVVTRKITITR